MVLLMAEERPFISDAGKTESNPLTVVRDNNIDDAVTVAFGKPPKLGWRYSGYAFETFLTTL